MRARWVLMIMLFAALCTGCRKDGASASASAKWQNSANWKQVRPAMTQDQIRNILGEPTRIDVNPAFTDWIYGEEKGGKVTFAGTMVKDWKSPE